MLHRHDERQHISRNCRKSGLGTAAQKAAIARFAEAKGFEVVAELVEVETGKGSDPLERRPLLREALAVASCA